MILKTVLKKEAESFSHLDPFSIISRLELPGYFCIAAFWEEKADKPLGIMICNDSGKGLFIEWLCVAPEWRGRGVGEQLLAGAYRIAFAKGYEKLGAAMPDFAERSRHCPIEEAYFYARYFEEQKTAGEWHIKLLPILKKTTVTDTIEDCRGAEEYMTFSKLTGHARLSVLETLDRDPMAASLYPLLENASQIDGISSVCMMDDKLTGAAVFQESEGRLFLVAIYAPVKKQVAYLLAKSLDAARELYPRDGVHIIFRNREYNDAIARFIGGPTPVKLMYSETRSFFMDGQIPVDTPGFFEAFLDSEELASDQEPQL